MTKHPEMNHSSSFLGCIKPIGLRVFKNKAMKELSFHPVLELQALNTIEVLNVVGDNNQSLADCLSSNDDVKIINHVPLLLKQMLNFGIIFTIRGKWVYVNILNQSGYLVHFLNKVFLFLFSGKLRTIIQLMKRYYRHTASVYANTLQLLHNSRTVIENVYQEFVSRRYCLLVITVPVVHFAQPEMMTFMNHPFHFLCGGLPFIL